VAAQDVDDVLHGAFMAIVAAVQSGAVREPEALIGFARTITARRISERIRSYVRDRNHRSSDGKEVERAIGSTDLQSEYINNERREQMRKCLQQLSPRDREVLHRFYLLEQPKEQICAEMNMTETSFRLAKSRAKAKLTQKVTATAATSSGSTRPHAGVAA
jgi:RNA polymerase sigma-70 factor, ECF subfamily